MEIIFTLTRYDHEKLQAPLAQALDLISELLSRKRYPQFWKKSILRPKEPTTGSTRPARIRTNRIWGAVLLAVGVFAMVPGMVNPKELMLPLVAGAYCTVSGVMKLLMAAKLAAPRFEKEAKELLDGMDKLMDAAQPGTEVTVRFVNSGLVLGGNAPIAYERVETAVENALMLVINWDDKVTLLQKSDLTQGTMSQLRELLTRKVPEPEVRLRLLQEEDAQS